MNTGFDIEKEKADSSELDWVFGAVSIPCLAQIPENRRDALLPKGEVQRGIEDTMDCATRGPNNKLEAKFNWLLRNRLLSPANEKWFRDNGYVTEHGTEFSDAFPAILSKTTRDGNSLKAPLEAIKNHGLVPKSRLPLEPWMTWSEYHDPERVTGSLLALGEQFKARFPINYEKVYEKDYEKLLKEDMLIVAGYAWPKPINGEYPRTDEQPNHAFIVTRSPLYFAFDNYIENESFIKKLANDYDFLDYGYRIYIREEIRVQKDWFSSLISSICSIF